MASPVGPSERPGWGEVSVGLIVLGVVGFGGGAFIAQLPIEPAFIGLIFTGLTGVAGLAGCFSCAFTCWPRLACGRHPCGG